MNENSRIPNERLKRWEELMSEILTGFHTGVLPSQPCRGSGVCQDPWGCWVHPEGAKAEGRAWSHLLELLHQNYCVESQSFHGPGNCCLTNKSRVEKWDAVTSGTISQRCGGRNARFAEPFKKHTGVYFTQYCKKDLAQDWTWFGLLVTKDDPISSFLFSNDEAVFTFTLDDCIYIYPILFTVKWWSVYSTTTFL